jgi:hypothetical protein
MRVSGGAIVSPVALSWVYVNEDGVGRCSAKMNVLFAGLMPISYAVRLEV